MKRAEHPVIALRRLGRAVATTSPLFREAPVRTFGPPAALAMGEWFGDRILKGMREIAEELSVADTRATVETCLEVGELIADFPIERFNNQDAKFSVASAWWFRELAAILASEKTPRERIIHVPDDVWFRGPDDSWAGTLMRDLVEREPWLGPTLVTADALRECAKGHAHELAERPGWMAARWVVSQNSARAFRRAS